MEQFEQLKSRRLDYWDYDKGTTRSRRFTALEIAHANKIFDIIECILSENNLGLRSKYVSAGKCEYGTHTFFMVQVDSDVLEMHVLSDIKEALEEYSRDVELIDVAGKHERQKNFLQLVISQKHQSVKGNCL
jgi:hypothetical protein